MQLNNYPIYSCSDCCNEHGGKWPQGHIGSFHVGICDVCNEWKSITSPSDYSYPKFNSKHDWDKIFCQLLMAMNDFWKNKDFYSAIQVSYLLEDLFHQRLETLGEKDGSTNILRTNERRKTRKRNRKTT